MTALTDRRGTPIQVGARVAYNLSGNVALGEVVGVAPGTAVPGPSWSRYGRWMKNPVVRVRADRGWQSLAAKDGVSVLRVIDHPGSPVGKITVLP
jgi:hypothetical protein